MKFFFPDSQDQIDPGFNFQTEQSSEFRVRQRDDRYAHEVLTRPAYDGLLVSKPIVDGLPGVSGKYTNAQRHRLYRIGVRRFFRLDQPASPIASMADCGAFTYVREETPPYTIADVVDFYEGCDFDFGISVDHVILGYDATNTAETVPDWARRQRLTLDLAAEFRDYHRSHNCRFHPIGVAQGWSPSSYAAAVTELQDLGYDYIALGGMVPLRTSQIADCVNAASDVRRSNTRLHLLGISRCEQIPEFEGKGVASFDSTSPFRQAFKDDRDNYYVLDRAYAAIRVPQVDGNTRLRLRIQAGRVDQTKARIAEQRCLTRLAAFDAGKSSVKGVLDALSAYADIVEPERDYSVQHRELLEASPWKTCDCGICKRVGIQVCVFRGTERNKRRGFHNLCVFSRRLIENVENKKAVGALA
jgi:hypothetical protein